MSEGVIDANTRRGSATPIAQDCEEAAGEQAEMTQISPKIVTTSEADVHQLLKQMTRMRELLSVKEAEVKSELTFSRGEVETARDEALDTR